MTNRNTWTEEIEVNARDIIEKIKELIQEGNVRRLIIKKKMATFFRSTLNHWSCCRWNSNPSCSDSGGAGGNGSSFNQSEV